MVWKIFKGPHADCKGVLGSAKPGISVVVSIVHHPEGQSSDRVDQPSIASPQGCMLVEAQGIQTLHRSAVNQSPRCQWY